MTRNDSLCSFFRLIPGVLASCVLFSCSPPKEGASLPADSGRPRVHASNYPLFYFADRIAGDGIELQFLPGGEDGDPAFWKPSEKAILQLQEADLILLNGATYEKWLDTASLPVSTRIDTSAGFSDRFIVIEKAGSHSHGAKGEHSHAGTAFTTWIDFQQARRQAEGVRDALLEAMPDSKPEIEANAASLLEEIDQLDRDLLAVAKRIGDQPLAASHPVYQYFARRYGLEIRAVLWEPETVPDESAMADLKKILEGHPARWMIWEGDPAEESVAKLRAIGMQSVVFDPCGNRPEAGDWLTVMRRNVANLEKTGG